MDANMYYKVTRSCRLKSKPSLLSRTIKYISKRDCLLVLDSTSVTGWAKVSIKQFEPNARRINMYTWIDGWIKI